MDAVIQLRFDLELARVIDDIRAAAALGEGDYGPYVPDNNPDDDEVGFVQGWRGNIPRPESPRPDPDANLEPPSRTGCMPGAKARAFQAMGLEEERAILIEKGRNARSPDALQELTQEISQRASAEVRADQEAMMAVVSAQGALLEYCSEELRGNVEIVLAAMSQDPQAFLYASRPLLSNKYLALRAVMSNGSLLALVGDDLADDPDVVGLAVQSWGLALERASTRLRGDKDIVLQAVHNEPSALQYASANLRADREVVTEAVSGRCSALRFASGVLRADKDLVCAAMELDPEVLQYACPSIMLDREVVTKALLRSKLLDQDVLLILLRAEPELRNDKEMLVFAARCARNRACIENLYREAPGALKASFRMKAFLEATESVIAAQGEEAPILTVGLALPNSGPGQKRTFIADVSLLSGTTFTSEVVVEDERNPPNLNDLALVLIEDLSKRTEVTDIIRVYINFATNNGEHVCVSAWDWSRLLFEFV